MALNTNLTTLQGYFGSLKSAILDNLLTATSGDQIAFNPATGFFETSAGDVLGFASGDSAILNPNIASYIAQIDTITALLQTEVVGVKTQVEVDSEIANALNVKVDALTHTATMIKTAIDYHASATNTAVKGNALNNVISANDSGNVINGGGGLDTLNGGTASDTLNGDAGNDQLNGDAGSDTLNGGAGNDTMNGDAGDDVLEGGKGNDAENGGIGADILFGDAGNDTLNGGDNNDTIEGSAGIDALTGGTGADSFVFNVVKTSVDIAATATAPASVKVTEVSDSAFGKSDTITDYSQTDGDVITLDVGTAITLIGNYTPEVKAVTYKAAVAEIPASTDPVTGVVTAAIPATPERLAVAAVAAVNLPTQGQAAFDVAKGTLYVNTDADANFELSIQLTGITDAAQITLASIV